MHPLRLDGDWLPAAPLRSAGRCALPCGIDTGECTAFARCALNASRATVQFHQFENERQANAGAFVRPSARALNAMKPLKYAALVLM